MTLSFKVSKVKINRTKDFALECIDLKLVVSKQETQKQHLTLPLFSLLGTEEKNLFRRGTLA